MPIATRVLHSYDSQRLRFRSKAQQEQAGERRSSAPGDLGQFARSPCPPEWRPVVSGRTGRLRINGGPRSLGGSAAGRWMDRGPGSADRDPDPTQTPAQTRSPSELHEQ